MFTYECIPDTKVIIINTGRCLQNISIPRIRICGRKTMWSLVYGVFTIMEINILNNYLLSSIVNVRWSKNHRKTLMYA